MNVKTYSSKSNAARAAKAANGGTLDGLELRASNGGWHYVEAAPKAAPKAAPAPKAASNGKGMSASAAKAIAQARLRIERDAKAAAKAAPAPKAGTSPKRTIEKNRDVGEFGVKRPSVGTCARTLWDFFSAMRLEDSALSIKAVKASPQLQKFNPNQVSIEFYNWRKFHGITGRQ